MSPFRLSETSDLPPTYRASPFDQFAHLNRLLAAETERWIRKALERGPGWNVWRSDALCGDDGDPFIIKHEFQLVPAGATLSKGVLFTQPDLTDGERVRLLAGRHDWREHEWEDECGVLDCKHPCCEDARR